MRAAVVAGLVGGLCWVGALWADPLAWVGALLLAVAALGAGAGLVSRGATWLRRIVAVCLLALAGSVVEVLRESLDDRAVLAGVGAVAFAVAALALSRRPPVGTRSRGTHAA
jgi:hypothetical protein